MFKSSWDFSYVYVKVMKKKNTLQTNINKIHSNKQPNTTPEDDQQNGRKRLG